MAKFGSAFIVISRQWTTLKLDVTSKSLALQYDEDVDKYQIFALDNQIVYLAFIFKGSVPTDQTDLDQITNDANKNDFETNYKPSANKRIQVVTLSSGTIAGTSQVVSGTVNLDRGNSSLSPLFIAGSLSTTPPLATNVTGSVGVYTTGPQLVSGSVSVFTQGPLSVSGSVAVFTQGPQAVSGTVFVTTTGSFPVVVSNTIKTYDTGVQAVSGSVSVFTQGPQQVTGSVSIYTQGPQAVTGSLAVYTQGAQLVSGTVKTFDTGIQAVSGSVSVYTQGAQQVTGSVNVYTTGPQAVTGTVGVNNFPVVQAVSGSQVTGSTYNGAPVIMGGVDATNDLGTGSIVRGVDVDSSGRVFTSPAGLSAPVFGVAHGWITLAVVTVNALRETTYTEPTSNAQRSVSSNNAADTSAGTGARTIRITYYTSTYTGPFTETLTLNGTANVNTVNTNICFIEKIEVVTVGSGGTNAGVISLFAATAGGGGTVGTIATGDGITYWAHHYIAPGVFCKVTNVNVANNANQPMQFTLKYRPSGANQFEVPRDWVRPAVASIGGALQRFYDPPLEFNGPGRVVLYVKPDNAATAIFFGSFDYYDD